MAPFPKTRPGWLFAALAVPLASAAFAGDPAVEVAPDGRRIVIEGLPPADLSALRDAPDGVRLNLAGADVAMPVDVDPAANVLVVTSRFPLVAGQRYDLTLRLDEPMTFAGLGREATAGAPPVVRGVHPAARTVPANLLRLRIAFSRPMARGQLRRAVRLKDGAGRSLDSPFLNLDVELWNADQTVATLYLDPGRTKRDVGPNLSHGAPLVQGKRYRLVVSGLMKGADGRSLGEDFAHEFAVGPALRRPVKVENWTVDSVTAGTREPLVVEFARLMDRAGAHRIRVFGPNGRPLAGSVDMTGHRWTFRPRHSWRAGNVRLSIDPLMEDVAANSLLRAFDTRGSPSVWKAWTSIRVPVRRATYSDG